MKRGGPLKRSVIHTLRPGEDRPAGEPRRYEDRDGYVRLRWKVAPYTYVETRERHADGTPVRTQSPRGKRLDGAEVLRLYESGMTQTEVASKIGASAGAVSRVLRRGGGVARKSTSYRYPEPNPVDVVRLYEAGVGLQAVGRTVGCTSGTVMKVLEKEGVRTRRPGSPGKVPGRVVYETEFQQMRPVIRQRSRGLCEARIPGICDVQAHHVHHRKLRRRGGENSLANLLDLCERCHKWAHGHPLIASRWGLLVATYHDPAKVPVQVGRP